MDDNSPILDYASPRKRVRLRLPALSSLIWDVDRDEVVVREMLQGKSGAVGAIVFAVFTLCVLGFDTFVPHGFGQMGPYGLITPIAFALSELTLIPLVIHQTWRQTRLTVRYNEILLAFTSPLYRKHYQWTGNDIADILLVQTANSETNHALAELLITRVTGGDVHLFTDHMATQIHTLVTTLLPMLRDGRAAGLPPLMASPAESPDPSIAASEASARLINMHRELRKRQP